MRFLSIGRTKLGERIKSGFIMVRWRDADYGGKDIMVGITSPFWTKGKVKQFHTFHDYEGKYRKAWMVQFRVRFLRSELTPEDLKY